MFKQFPTMLILNFFRIMQGAAKTNYTPIKVFAKTINVSKQYADKVVMHRTGVIEIGRKIGVPYVWMLQHDILKYLPNSLVFNGIHRYAPHLKEYPLIAKLITIQKKIHVTINPHHPQFVLWNTPFVKRKYGGIFMPKIIAKEGAADVIQSIKEDFPEFAAPNTLNEFLQSAIFMEAQPNYQKLCPNTKKWYNQAYSQYYGFPFNVVNNVTTPMLSV